jgi:uncharacterized membrane protein
MYYSSNLNNSRIFLVFMACSFLGWLSEVVYVGIFFEHKFVNRGFLHGPICPIYGFGGLIILFLLSPWKDTWMKLFFASVILTSLLEYTTSWILETLFHTKWWDYSNKRGNINGRVCLMNSFLFGIMGLLGEHFFRPFVFNLLGKLNDQTAFWLATTLFIFFAADIIATTRRLVDFNTGLAKLKEFSESLRDHYTTETWFKDSDISCMLSSILDRARIDKAKFNAVFLNKVESFRTLSKNTERWLRRFPTMTSNDYASSLIQLKARLAEKKQSHRRNTPDKD